MFFMMHVDMISNSVLIILSYIVNCDVSLKMIYEFNLEIWVIVLIVLIILRCRGILPTHRQTYGLETSRPVPSFVHLGS